MQKSFVKSIDINNIVSIKLIVYGNEHFSSSDGLFQTVNIHPLCRRTFLILRQAISDNAYTDMEEELLSHDVTTKY